jgi:hypothetical protein
VSKIAVVINRIERTATYANVTVTLSPVPERGVPAVRPYVRILAIDGPVTLAGVTAAVQADALRAKEQRDMVGAAFEVDV